MWFLPYLLRSVISLRCQFYVDISACYDNMVIFRVYVFDLSLRGEILQFNWEWFSFTGDSREREACGISRSMHG
jgi:hypothetical protein